VQRKEEIVAEAALLAKKRADEIVALAEKQAERIQNEAAQKATNLEKELKDGFVDGVRNTTKLIVTKLINDDVALQNTYIDGLVQEFVGRK
jgi:F0F1-type ATP synthase membrane subunit b/b'